MPNTFTAPDDQLMIRIYTTAARAIVAREHRLQLRARVRWTPAIANELRDAATSRAAFLRGFPSDTDNRRAWRASLIDDAELAHAATRL